MYHKDDKVTYTGWADVIVAGVYRGLFALAVTGSVCGVLGLTDDDLKPLQKVLFPEAFKAATPEKVVVPEYTPE